jgi:putative ABC transport system substrate-binding protein
MEAASGLDEYLQDQGGTAEIVIWEDMDAFQKEHLADQLQKQSYQAAVGIGPQAMNFLWEKNRTELPILFSMVLHPEQVVPQNSLPLCGISLSIPVDIQLQSIEHFLPERRRIGLLFHPDHNQDFYEQSVKAARERDLRIIPLPITDQGAVDQVLNQHLSEVDALWMIPGQALTSKKIVEYIIKQALYARVPVIGYNRFFYESGAAVAFVFDYARIGRQTGRLLMHKLEKGLCNVQPAEFRVWKHDRIYRLLDLDHE